MTGSIGRRRVLLGLGTAGVGGILAACGGDDDGAADRSATASTSAPTTTTTTTTTTTGAGGDGVSGSDLVGRFEDAATCSITPEAMEGPYYLDIDQVRRDIREGQEGTTLRLGIRVLDAACAPLPDAVVDVWHCNATGLYSGFEQASQGGPAAGQTDAEIYLRGTQVTDPNGIVEFTTVYPGWYPGRTVHVHAKVHLDNRQVLTTQFYFDEAVTAEVFQQQPYAADPGRDAFNDNDALFLADTLLTLAPEGEGYLGLINLTVDDGRGT